MFTIPSIWKNTPAERNEQRRVEMLARVETVKSRLADAIVELDNLRSGFTNLTGEDMAGLDVGQVQNLGHSAGRMAHDVQRAMDRASETLMETVVLGSGFESVVD